MNKSPILLIFILASLSLLSSALNPSLQNNYFYVPAHNHLSYELYQTRNGIIAHNIDSLDEKNTISRYSRTNLATKDAVPILSDLVSSCDNLNPMFQSLHYHNQTDSLVYYCAKNTSLLILNQQDYTVKDIIPFSLPATLPIARLSTDGMSVIVLLMDTLFIQSPKNSVLIKVDVQKKAISNLISFNQIGESVVAYAAGNKYNYIATNIVQGDALTTIVYSINMIGNTYQLNKVATFPGGSINPFQIITKLFCLENYIIVTNGVNLFFVNQQGAVVKSIQTQSKALNGQNNILLQPTVTSQNGASLFVLSVNFRLDIYSVVNTVIQTKELPDNTGDFQVAFGNPATAGGDLLLVLDYSKTFFSILETKAFQPVYQAASGYIDIMVTDSTYAVVQGSGPGHYWVYIFDLKTGAFKKDLALGTKDYYYNKDQNMITLLTPLTPSGCVLYHIDIVSGKTWTTSTFAQANPICSSYVASARVTDKGYPEVVFPFANRYTIISATYGQLTFLNASAIDSLNVNFDTLSLYYFSANQAGNGMTASLYSFNTSTRNFVCANSFDLERPVKDHGFFNLDQDTILGLSSTSFVSINSLNSIWYFDNFTNNYNLVTPFTDASGDRFVLFGYNNSQSISGDGPVLLTRYSSKFVDIRGKRANTVNGRATGSNSFSLQDDLYSAIGLVRLYSSDSNQKRKFLSF